MTQIIHGIDSIAVYLKSLPSRPPARLFTILPPKARLAYVEAWLKRSQRENATVLVMVRTNAMAGIELAFNFGSTTIDVNIRIGRLTH